MARLTTIIVLATCLHLSAETYGQTITLSKKNASLSEIFLSIYQQTGYYFLYKDDLLKDARKVTIEVKDATLKEVLKICFEDQPISFTISDHTIVVVRKQMPVPDRNLPLTINGKVINERGEPMEGAYVFIKGTNTGVQTDSKGNFTIRADPDSVELLVSYAGYQTKTVSAHRGEIVRVTLSLSNNLLDQVQVIAYGITSRRLNTGDVSTVTAETITSQPVSNPLAALEGRVAGLVVTQQTGVPGGSFNVQIRGQSSIFNGNNPLYIIDGVPFTGTSINSDIVGASINGGGSAFSNIDPSNIESIDILKDADATAIYGSRGANGVVLITTKKGKSGKTSFDFNINAGAGSVTHMMPLLNTNNYLLMRHEAFTNDGATPDPAFDYDLTVWDTSRYTNWQNEIIGNNSSITNIQANLSGGNNNTQYILGGNYYHTTTVFPGDFADQKISTHFGLTQSSLDGRFKLSFSGNYILDDNNLPAFDPTRYAVTLPPDAPAGLKPDGQINWENGTFTYNPYQFLLQPYKSNANNLIGDLTMSYSFIKGLDIKVNLGYNRMQISETAEFPIATLNPAYGQTTGSAYFSNQSLNSWIIEPQAEYKKSGKAGKFDLLIGLTFQQNLNKGENLSATGFTNDAFLENIAAASQIYVISSKDIDYRYQSGFARLNYNWQDKYILNLTGRRDGSSRFGPGNQFANFGAIGGAWLFSNEKWWKEFFPFISFGKLRGSYGITGNDQIGDYGYLDSWTPTPYPYQGLSGLQPTGLANADYGWENNRKSELGVDLGLLKDKILFSVSYYENKSSNQLINYTLPGITGFAGIVQNSVATVRNSGFEFELNIANIKSKNFSWQAGINLTIPKNELLNYPGLSGSPYANTYVVGKSLSILKAYHYTGVNAQTGLYSFQSKDPANPVYPDDLKAVKQLGARYYGGFQNSFSYKNWRLGFFIQFVDQLGYNYLYYNFTQPGMSGNQPDWVLNRWQKSGDRPLVEKFSQNYGEAYSSYLNVTTSSDQVLSDASYIRLKTLDFSYTFSGNWMKKMKLEGLRIYVQGQNLFTITHYMGMDPENQNLTTLPPLKILTAGFQCNF